MTVPEMSNPGGLYVLQQDLTVTDLPITPEKVLRENKKLSSLPPENVVVIKY
ncbi:hypothetical protein ACFLYV_04425 [Chloroflexota bacterium]